MSQPVKLSDALVLDARLAGEILERSIAGQVEFWARLGRSVESMLDGQKVFEIARRGGGRPVSESLETVDTSEGRQRVGEYLQSLPFPHYEQHPDLPGMLIRIEADGKRTAGRFVNRQFEALKSKPKR